MPLPLDQITTPTSDAADARRDLGLTRRTSRSFACAVAVLLLATLVSSRSSATLQGEPSKANSVVSAGSIEISDDDRGRSLFELDDLAPARPSERCIEIVYTGSILPVTLGMEATAQGSLTEFLDVTIDHGTGGSYESCDGFVADAVLFTGTLDTLADSDMLQTGEFLNTGESRAFRIVIEMQDRSEALGQSTSLEFAWEVTPS